MEKLKRWLREWLGVPSVADALSDARDEAALQANNLFALRMTEAEMGIADLEAAYPDYNKAKEKAEADQKNEVVPGFRPFSQRKRGWENAHRKTADKKEQSGSV